MQLIEFCHPASHSLQTTALWKISRKCDACLRQQGPQGVWCTIEVCSTLPALKQVVLEALLRSKMQIGKYWKTKAVLSKKEKRQGQHLDRQKRGNFWAPIEKPAM